MELLVVRHAAAEDREDWARAGRPDAERGLTPAGRRKFKAAISGLRALVPAVDLIAASPFARAAETAALLGRAYRRAEVVPRPELEPDASIPALVRWLGAVPPERVVALVGHQPHLARLVAQLVAGRDVPFVDLKPGGACLLELDGSPRRGAARLCWLVTCRQLRHLV